MSDFDFLKEFGKNLDQERHFEASDDNWEKVATALNTGVQRERRRRRVLLLAWPLAASLAIAGLGTSLFKTMNRADEMQAEIFQLKEKADAENSHYTSDTVQTHFSVVQYDTVYRTVFIDRYVSPTIYRIGQSNRNDAISKEAAGIAEYAQTQIGTNEILIGENTSPKDIKGTNPSATQLVARSAKDMENGNSLNRTIDAGIKGQQQVQSPDSIAFKNNLILFLKPRPLETRILHSLSKRPLLRKGTVMLPMTSAQVSLIQRLRPHDFAVGVTGGMLFPITTPQATPLNSYTLGIAGQMGIGRHWQLHAGIERGWADFQVTASGLDNSNIPQLSPPTPNDMLEYVRVDQPLWDFSLGLGYVFTPEKRLRPFIGMAWVGEQTQEQTLRYEFKNQVTEEETYILAPYNDTRFNPNGLQIGLGAEWTFAKQLSFGIEGIYQRQYNTTVPMLAKRWELKAGVVYNF